MAEDDDLKFVAAPRHLNELLHLLADNPGSIIYSGGTNILLKKKNNPALFKDKALLYLGEVEELSRILRTERFLEIGANVTIAKLLSIGKNVVPPPFVKALTLTATPAIRNLATLGGNICQASPYSTIMPVLIALDAALELKSLTSARWVPVQRFLTSAGEKSLRQGEVLTRIRIPYREWTYHTMQKIAIKRTQRKPGLVFCALASVVKGTLTTIPMAFGAIGPRIFRNPDLEIALTGRKLPIGGKEVSLFLGSLEEQLVTYDDEHFSGIYKKQTALKLVRWFLEEIS